MGGQELSPWVQAALAYINALHGVGGRTRWTLAVVNLQFFIDDAGKVAEAANQPFCGAAGYIAPADHWAAYLVEWEQALPADMRGGKFHFKTFIREIGNRTRPADQLPPLLDVIGSHVFIGFSHLVHSESWRALPSQYRKLFLDPYPLSTLVLLQAAVNYLQNFDGIAPEERLVVIAEHMDDYTPGKPLSAAQRRRRRIEDRTRRLWDLYVEINGLRGRVPTIAFDDPQQAPQLQAADLFAHASYRVLSRPHLPTRFIGLPYTSPSASPPFPRVVYEAMGNFMRGHRPRHFWGAPNIPALKKMYPFFDTMIDLLAADDDDEDVS
jgi:hypothetical protein